SNRDCSSDLCSSDLTRNTLDITAVPWLKERTHLPIIVDPSHAAGIYNMVRPLSMAAISSGCDGLMIEVHNDPVHALSDGAQSINPERFDSLVDDLFKLKDFLNNENIKFFLQASVFFHYLFYL